LALSTLADLAVNETDPGKRERLLEALEELHQLSGQLAAKELAAKEEQLAAKEEQLKSVRGEMAWRLEFARRQEREARREELKAKGLFHIRGFLGRLPFVSRAFRLLPYGS
jgi:hypothetical protein